VTRPHPEPWLTVVMPVHNGADYLRATLASVVTEPVDGIEFLLIDSSNDERCAMIVRDFAQSLTLRYIPRPDVKPWPTKTNIGVEMARAQHVAMLHQDDIWLPGHVEAVRKSIEEAPDAVMSVAASRFMDVNARDLGQWSLPLAAGLRAGEAVGQRLIVQNFVAIPSPVIRRDAWLKVGGLDPMLWYTADWDLYLKLAKSGRVAVRRQATTAFRIHGGSLTMTGSRDAGDLRQQLEIVLERHGESFGLNRDRHLKARALASVEINVGLALAAAGEARSLLGTFGTLLRLGPVNAVRYIQNSRIVERVWSRMRTRISGVL
jgi:GT2 family glycosyltransferase